MEKIRTKDKVFVALVLPAALAWAYVALWRTDAVKRLDALTRECDALVEKDEFPLRKRAAERRVAEAKAALEAERKVAMPQTKVKAEAAETPAERERAVIGVLREHGLRVTRSGEAEAKEATGGEVLRATGTRPDPLCRAYEVEGAYPDVVAALRAFGERQMAVVPEALAMSARGKWRLTLWL